MNPVVQITEEERVLLTDQVERMTKNMTGRPDLKISKADPKLLMKMGYAGELAVFKYFGLEYGYPVRKWRIRWDIKLHFGERVVICDVKTSSDGMMRVPTWQVDINPEELREGEEIPDTYIGCFIDEDMTQVEILGIISKKHFVQIARLEPRWKKQYILEKGLQQYELSSIDLLSK
jgi:hypothetical protein